MILYVDLFAGIGGFHEALNQIKNTRCVFASEIDQHAANIYEKNHKLKPSGDISTIKSENIPSFNLLCAGFPCQPFSKSGKQIGFNDVRGTLFFDILRILRFHKPKYLLLENVANLISHDNGNTYKVIIESLKKLGYSLPEKPLIISPTDIGIPVNRPRTFIPGIKNHTSEYIHFNIPKFDKKKLSIMDYYKFKKINIKSNAELFISEYELNVLIMWDEFYQGLKTKTIGFPIWFDNFKDENIDSSLPDWKLNFLNKNKLLYAENKKHIDKWSLKYENLNWVLKSHRKFEWQCGIDCKSIFDGLIQFRPSGVRVKRLNYFSTLVAMNQPQIIGPLRRRLSSNEVKDLQSFNKKFKVHENRNIALKQFGNAVNVEVVKYILNQIIQL
jgi:DNA (cytosine-5)-methyltransferase 1